MREFPTDTGPADYVLFINRQAVGVLEAKKDTAGENLSVTEVQTERYATANLKWRKDNILRAFPVPVAPAEKQLEVLEQIQSQLVNLSQQERTINLVMKQSTAQRQNILRVAFTGQLVPQDPNDEPASVLLARIRAARAAQGAVKKPRLRKAKEAA